MDVATPHTDNFHFITHRPMACISGNHLSSIIECSNNFNGMSSTIQCCDLYAWPNVPYSRPAECPKNLAVILISVTLEFKPYLRTHYTIVTVSCRGMVTLVLMVAALCKLCSTLDIKVHKYTILPCATCINYIHCRACPKNLGPKFLVLI